MGCLRALHLLRADVAVASVLDVSNGDAASDLGEESQSHDGDGNRHLLVARDGSLDNKLAELALDVEDRASVELAPGSTADAWKHGGAKLEAELAVQAADTSLSGAAEAVGVHVKTAVGAANCTAEHDVFLINSVVGVHGCKKGREKKELKGLPRKVRIQGLCAKTDDTKSIAYLPTNEARRKDMGSLSPKGMPVSCEIFVLRASTTSVGFY